MIKDSLRVVARVGEQFGLIASFAERLSSNGTILPATQISSVFKAVSASHPLFPYEAKVASYTSKSDNDNFDSNIIDVMIPEAKLANFLASDYLNHESIAIQVCKKIAGFYILQIRSLKPNVNEAFRESVKAQKATAAAFVSALPEEPVIELPAFPTKAVTVQPVAVLPVPSTAEATKSMSEAELMKMFQS